MFLTQKKDEQEKPTTSPLSLMEQIEQQQSLALQRKKTRIRTLKKRRRLRQKKRKKRGTLKPLHRIQSLHKLKFRPKIQSFNKTSKRIASNQDVTKSAKSKGKKRKSKFYQSMYNMKKVKKKMEEQVDTQLETSNQQDYSLFSNINYIQDRPIQQGQGVGPFNMVLPSISVDLDQNILTETMRRNSFFDKTNSTQNNLLITREMS